MCIPCAIRDQRQQFKRNAIIKRAKDWGKEQGLKEVMVFALADDEGEDDRYSYGADAPEGAKGIEYLSIQG